MPGCAGGHLIKVRCSVSVNESTIYRKISRRGVTPAQFQEEVLLRTVSKGNGLWGMPVVPSLTYKQKILQAFSKKGAIELQTAVSLI